MSDKQVIEQRIYIGNVDFKATEDDLRKHFEGLNVTDVDIPTKTTIRSKKTHTKHLGFAFVEFASKEDADEAVEKFNRKAFLGREITIKKAVPPATEEEKEKKKEAYKAHKSELEKKKKAEKKKKKNQEERAKKEEAKKEHDNEGESKEAIEDSNDVKADSKSENIKKPRAKRQNKRKTAKEVEQTDKKEDASEGSNIKAKQPNGNDNSNQPKQIKIPEGKASEDTIFITNLDYRVGVKTLNDLFRDFKPKWIHVPTKINHSNRSNGPRRVLNKGIAFVKFSSHELQQKAIQEFNEKSIKGRNIFVDIAIDARSNDVSEGEVSTPTPVELSD